jgi:hypothetical protein
LPPSRAGDLRPHVARLGRAKAANLPTRWPRWPCRVERLWSATTRLIRSTATACSLPPGFVAANWRGAVVPGGGRAGGGRRERRQAAGPIWSNDFVPALVGPTRSPTFSASVPSQNSSTTWSTAPEQGSPNRLWNTASRSTHRSFLSLPLPPASPFAWNGDAGRVRLITGDRSPQPVLPLPRRPSGLRN